MTEPFLGQIALFGFSFPPKGWALCAGQLLPIAQNTALFSLLGTTYGGDGRTTFALPDLRGRSIISYSTSRVQGESAGSETVTLQEANLPEHSHPLTVQNTMATSDDPTSNFLAKYNVVPEGGSFPEPVRAYSADPTDTTLHGQSIGSSGGSQSHNNMQPYLALNYSICIQGIFPRRS